MRQTELKEDGTIVATDYDRRGHVVKQTFYRSSDKKLLMRILESLQADA